MPARDTQPCSFVGTAIIQRLKTYDRSCIIITFRPPRSGTYTSLLKANDCFYTPLMSLLPTSSTDSLFIRFPGIGGTSPAHETMSARSEISVSVIIESRQAMSSSFSRIWERMQAWRMSMLVRMTKHTIFLIAPRKRLNRSSNRSRSVKFHISGGRIPERRPREQTNRVGFSSRRALVFGTFLE